MKCKDCDYRLVLADGHSVCDHIESRCCCKRVTKTKRACTKFVKNWKLK